MTSTDGIIFFALLVGACVIGMIAAMLGSDRVIEDLYGLPPVNTSKETRKDLKKGKTHER